MKIIICIDGLPYDLFTEENAPFLYNYSKQNHSARLETLFAFTGLEYTFFTGETPDKSDIWLEFVKNNDSIFKSKIFTLNNHLAALLQLIKKRTWLSSLHNIPKNKVKYFDTSVKQGVWKLDFFKNKTFSVYKWPFFVTENKNKLIFKYESDEKRLNRLFSQKNKDIYYTQLIGVDKVIHKFGRNSLETKQAIQKLDKILGIHLNNFIQENSNTEIFIWSDHGFADIEEYINLEDFLPQRNDYLYFIAGTTASFWFETQEAEDQVIKSLPESINILDEKTAKKNNVPLSNKYGDLVIFLKKGKYFFPNFYQSKSSEKFISMHGYPREKELDGFFISNIKIPKTLKIKDIKEIIA